MTRSKTLAEEPYRIEDGVTQSLLSDWVGCRQRCRYSLDGWRAPSSKEGLEFGSLFHWMLEQAYTLVRSREIRSVRAAIDAFEPLLKRYMGRYEQRRNESSLAPQTMELLAAQAEGVWAGYCMMWKHDFTKRKWISLESKFDVQFMDMFRLRGMRDGLFQNGKDLWLLETKTKSRWDPNELAMTLGFDFQNLYYLTATTLELEAAGKPSKIDGVLYNVIRRPQIKPDKDNNLAAYVKRIKEDVQVRPDFYFSRSENTYLQRDQRAFRDELFAKLCEFRQWLEEELPTYKNEQACVGRWACSYIKACSTGSLRGYTQDGRMFEELEE